MNIWVNGNEHSDLLFALRFNNRVNIDIGNSEEENRKYHYFITAFLKPTNEKYCSYEGDMTELEALGYCLTLDRKGREFDFQLDRQEINL